MLYLYVFSEYEPGIYAVQKFTGPCLFGVNLRLLFSNKAFKKDADTIRVRPLFECGPYWRYYGTQPAANYEKSFIRK